MAGHEGTSARVQRLSASAAVAALALAAAFTFGRVFETRPPSWKLALAALASVAVATLMERRGLFLATAASVAALFVAIAWLVFPKTLWYGLPTLDTLSAIGSALGKVGGQARVQIAPTLPFPPLMLAAVAAVWTASFSAHALAVRAGSPLLAVLPPVALVAFADSVLDDGARPLYAIAFLAATMLLVFVDGLRRVRGWGPVWAWQGRRRFWSATRGAQRVAAIVVGVALLTPWILPGFRSAPLVDLTAIGSDVVSLDPFVSLRADLERDESVDLFEVRSTGPDGEAVPAYWRMLALDSYDGAQGQWTASNMNGLGSPGVVTPASLVSSYPEGSIQVEQQFRALTDLGSPWLPLAYEVTSIDLRGEVVHYDEDKGAVAHEGGLDSGTSYAATSQVPVPAPEDLDAVTIDDFRQLPAYFRYTNLPGEVPAAALTVAELWTKGISSPYRQVLAIQDRFLSGAFAYSLDPPKVPGGQDPLIAFLLRTRIGFCQQFATAMAILVRELRLPARVAIGYRSPATPSDDGTYTVSSDQAHSWVEVLFPRYGWLAFEPTPGFWSNPVAAAGSYLNPEQPTDCAPGEKGCEAQGEASGEDQSGGLPGQLANFERRRGTEPSTSVGLPLPSEEEPGYRIPFRVILWIVLVLGAIALVSIPLVKGLWRRRSLRRGGDPREVVLATYRVFDGEAADLGLGRREGETLAEYRRRLERTVSLSDGHLGRLTAVTMRAAYSPDPIEPEAAARAREDARTAIQDMRRQAGIARRLLGVYRPGL